MVAQTTSPNGNGRFQPGHKLSTGPNAQAKKVNALRGVIYRAITIRDMREIFDAQKEAAKKGDLAAAKFLASYAVGDPALVVQLQATIDTGPTLSDYTQALLADPEAVAAHKRIAERMIGGRP